MIVVASWLVYSHMSVCTYSTVLVHNTITEYYLVRDLKESTEVDHIISGLLNRLITCTTGVAVGHCCTRNCPYRASLVM